LDIFIVVTQGETHAAIHPTVLARKEQIFTNPPMDELCLSWFGVIGVHPQVNSTNRSYFNKDIMGNFAVANK
jgi:hypothetical protein